MKKFTCAFLSLILLLSVSLLPVNAAVGSDGKTPGYGSVTTGEVGFSQSLVDTVKEVDGKQMVTYYQLVNGSTTEYEPITVDLATVPNIKGILNGTEGSYSINYTGANPSKHYKASNVWKISDANDLKALSILSNWNSGVTFRGKWIFMENDIDMTDVEIQPIGYGYASDTTTGVGVVQGQIKNMAGFQGYFDGLGHSIKNLTMKSDANTGGEVVALFGGIRGAVIQNLVIDASCSFSYTGTNISAMTAALVARAYVAGASNAGDAGNDSVAYYISQSRIGNTQLDENVDNAGTMGSYYIFNVENNANVTASCGNVAGILANSWATASGTPYVQNCTNNGTVSTKGNGNMHVTKAVYDEATAKWLTSDSWETTAADAGGVVGFLAKRTLRVLDCVNNGSVTASGIAAGIWAGISASEANSDMAGRMAAMGCVNNGKVTGGQCEGGILGQINKTNLSIRDCVNTGKLSGTATKSGQLYGEKTVESSVNANGLWHYNEEAIGDVTVDNGVEVVGIQRATATTSIGGKDYRSARLVGAVNLTEEELANYVGIGFEIRATYKLTDGTSTEYVTVTMSESDTAVYTSIREENENGDYNDLEPPTGGYFFAIVLKDIPCAVGEVTFQLTPYYTATDGTVTRGFTEVHTANLSA